MISTPYPGIRLLTCAATGFVCALVWSSSAASTPTEPTVTRHEQERITVAMDVASTNAPAAVRILTANTNESSSAALDFALGNVLFQADRFVEATRAYERALAKLDTFRAARVNLGHVRLLMDDASGAIDALTHVVRRGGADASTYKLLGQALLMEVMVVPAENAFRQALLFDPADSDALLGLAKCLLEQQRYAEGVALVERLLKDDPGRRELWSLRASLYLAMGNPDRALLALETAHRLGYATADMLATMGDLYVNREQPEEAAARYAAAFSGQSPSVGRLLRAAEAFLLNDEPEQADALLRLVRDAGEDHLKLTPVQENLRQRLEAKLAHRRGELDRACRLYVTLLQRDPLNGEALLRLGDLYRLQGRLEDALTAYERAARLEGHEAEGFVQQAQIEVERGHYARAAELLEASLVHADTARVRRYLEQVRRLHELTARSQ